METPRLSVIIVNYNVKEFLEQSLQAIRKASEPQETEVIIVDNHSVDHSVETIRKKFPWVRLITNDTNRGFAAASNQGIIASTGEYVLLLNPDTLVQEDTFSTMIEYLDSHPQVGVAGCKILNPDGSLQLACRRSFPSLQTALPKVLGLSKLFPGSKLFGRYNLTYLDENAEASVDAISGSFMMVRRAAIEEVGMLDESFFMYGEDLDWCYRFKEAGWDVRYVPDTKIIHYKGESSKLAPFDSYLEFYRAMILFVKKHFSTRWSFTFSLLIRGGILLRGSIGFLANTIQSFFPQLLDGFFILLAFLFAILLKFGGLQYVIDYSFLPLVYTLIWIGALSSTRSYSSRGYSVSNTFTGLVMGFVIISALTYFFKQFAYSRAVLLLAFIFSGILLGGWRFLYKTRSGTRLGRSVRNRRALIVGAGEEGKRIGERLQQQLVHGYNVIGFVDESADIQDAGEVLGSSDELQELVRVHDITDVIFTSDLYQNQEILAMVDALKDHQVELKIVPHSLEFILGKATVENLADIPLVELDFRLSSRIYRGVKRLMDIVLALILLPFTLILYLPVVLIMGYRFQGSEYASQNGNSFRGYQLWNREGESPVWGRAPMLWNVITGEMSLVGMPVTLARNAGEETLLFKPGMISLWELESGNPGELQQYNQYYMQHYSLTLDIQLLLRSIFRGVNGQPTGLV